MRFAVVLGNGMNGAPVAVRRSRPSGCGSVVATGQGGMFKRRAFNYLHFLNFWRTRHRRVS